MKEVTQKFGENAGKVWETLNKYGPLTENTLIKNTRLNVNDFSAAIGWLARENKICKNGLKYELRETNLTDKIGTDAGKVWTAISTLGEVDVSSITRVAQIKERDAYSALGWLAREDKIVSTEPPTREGKLKLRLK
jgi:hypothetical protein